MRLQTTCVYVCAVLAVWVLHLTDGRLPSSMSLTPTTISGEQTKILAKLTQLKKLHGETLVMCVLVEDDLEHLKMCQRFLEKLENFHKELERQYVRLNRPGI